MLIILRKIIYAEKQKIKNTLVHFFVVEITDINLAIKHTYYSISDISWINKFTDVAVREGYLIRANGTINYLSKHFDENSKINESTGEYLISITAKDTIVETLNYKDIPIGEVLGQKVSNNPGFDYYAENIKENYVVFGDAKYKTYSSSYTAALKQILMFIGQKRDFSDYISIKEFLENETIENMQKKIKGFSAGFTFLGKKENFITQIFQKEDFQELLKYKELILIGVKINEQK